MNSHLFIIVLVVSSHVGAVDYKERYETALQKLDDVLSIVSTQQEQITHLQELLEVKERYADTRADGRSSCQLGSMYEFVEEVNVTATGDSLPLPPTSSPQQCLYNCQIDVSCVGVNVQTSPLLCEGLSTISGTAAQDGTNFYRIATKFECVVDEAKATFEASLSIDTFYSSTARVVWDQFRAVAPNAFLPSGEYVCPVTGIYEFTLNAVSASFEYKSLSLVLYHSGQIIGNVFTIYNTGDMKIPGSVTAIVQCDGGDMVWVEMGADNILEGTFWRTSLTGQLLTITF